MDKSPRVLVLGASGKVGRLLRGVPGAGLGPATIWHSYRELVGFDTWDISQRPPRGVSFDAILNLAGGPNCNEEDGLALASAANRLAEQAGGVPHFYASSQAVYQVADAPISEIAPIAPPTPYGASKVAAEKVVRSYTKGVCLRIGNVAGADSLFNSMKSGVVTLDRFSDGSSPQRSYVGPGTLGKAITALTIRAVKQGLKHSVYNVASPKALEMAKIVDAAGVKRIPCVAPQTAIRLYALDVSRLSKIVPLEHCDANDIVEDAQAAGWEAGT